MKRCKRKKGRKKQSEKPNYKKNKIIIIIINKIQKIKPKKQNKTKQQKENNAANETQCMNPNWVGPTRFAPGVASPIFPLTSVKQDWPTCTVFHGAISLRLNRIGPPEPCSIMLYQASLKQYWPSRTVFRRVISSFTYCKMYRPLACKASRPWPVQYVDFFSFVQMRLSRSRVHRCFPLPFLV